MKEKEKVVIKSFPNGINLILKDEVPFEEILSEIAKKFSDARQFFGTAKMALSIEGRDLSEDEELAILDVIGQNSNVNIMCIVGHDEGKEQIFTNAMQQMEKKLSGGEDGQFYKGTLRNHQVLETENSIIIMGDVCPGCEVVSAKNIIILGGLYGQAYAGGNGLGGAYIVALEMAPERLKIGDFKYKRFTKQKWGFHHKLQPKIAYVKNERIVMEPLTKELLDTF